MGTVVRAVVEQLQPCVRARLDAQACILSCGVCLAGHMVLACVACDGMICVDVMHAMRDIHAVK